MKSITAQGNSNTARNPTNKRTGTPGMTRTCQEIQNTRKRCNTSVRWNETYPGAGRPEPDTSRTYSKDIVGYPPMILDILKSLLSYVVLQLFMIMISQAMALLLLVSSKLLQLLKRDLVQSLLIRRVQEDLRNNLRTLWVRLVRIKCLSPSIPEDQSRVQSNTYAKRSNSPANTKAPSATSLHARNGA
jgi:hypothetical protein